jgi:hypothetical protein
MSAVLSTPDTALDGEEDLLYLALSIARGCRARMDRMAWGTEYNDEFRRREIALDNARRHYLILAAAERSVTAIIAQMMKAEGL